MSGRVAGAVAATALTPIAAWAATAAAMGYFQGSVSWSLWHALESTPAVPALEAAPAVGLVIGAALGVRAIVNSRAPFRGAPFRKHMRGPQMIHARRLARRTRDIWRRRQISMAGVPVPLRIETQNFLLVGAPGAGKSVTFEEMYFKTMRRGDRAIVVDPNGEMLSKFWRPGDHILNPFDARSEGWSLWNEVRRPFDFPALAQSLVPLSTSADSEEWYGYARLLLSEVAAKLAMEGQPTLGRLMHYCSIADPEEVKTYLRGTPAESLFVGAERALSSARFVLSRCWQPLTYLRPGDFSIRNWLEDPSGGNLFITWREDMLPTLKPLISAWTDIFCSAVLSSPPDRRRRVWLFVDEIASLDQLPSLLSAGTKGRKHGLRIVAGLQSIAALEHVYGKARMDALLASFQSVLIMAGSKTSDSTALHFARALGKMEIERVQKSSQSGRSKGATSSQESEAPRHELADLILASELTHLNDLEGFLAFKGSRYPIAPVRLKPVNYKRQTERLVAA